MDALKRSVIAMAFDLGFELGLLACEARHVFLFSFLMSLVIVYRNLGHKRVMMWSIEC